MRESVISHLREGSSVARLRSNPLYPGVTTVESAPMPKRRRVCRDDSGWRSYADLVKDAGVAWVADRAPTMGAALAFYSAFALAPLLIIVITLAGLLFGSNAARQDIVHQLQAFVGTPAALAIQALLEGAETRVGIFATTLGAVTMLVGATTLLVELQDDLDIIWKAPKRAGSGVSTMMRARIESLGMFLAIAFLLLLSLIVSGAMAAFAIFARSRFPNATILLFWLAGQLFSLGAITVLFAMLFKGLPNVSIAWRDVWMGAFITAVLFSVGRIGIGLYLGGSAIASAYGAAGTLVVLLLWLYYSAQVFLFGAEFTCAYARRSGSVPCRRSGNAVAGVIADNGPNIHGATVIK